MAGPMPPQGPQPGPGPQGPPQPPQGPQPPMAPEPKPDPEGQSPAMEAVSMANDGLMKLGVIFEKSQGQVSPEEKSRLDGIIKEFHALIDSLSGEAPEESQPQKKMPNGPMDTMAGKGSTPLDQG